MVAVMVNDQTVSVKNFFESIILKIERQNKKSPFSFRFQTISVVCFVSIFLVLFLNY